MFLSPTGKDLYTYDREEDKTREEDPSCHKSQCEFQSFKKHGNTFLSSVSGRLQGRLGQTHRRPKAWKQRKQIKHR